MPFVYVAFSLIFGICCRIILRNVYTGPLMVLVISGLSAFAGKGVSFIPVIVLCVVFAVIGSLSGEKIKKIAEDYINKKNNQKNQ